MAKITGSGQRVLAELSQDPVARKNKYDTLKRQFDALERRADYLATRLEANQTRSNQGAYNAIVQQLQDTESRINSLATEMNSIAEASRYRAQEDRKQQRIDARKPKTTMDNVRESLPYALGSGVRDLIVNTGKGIGQTALYADTQRRTGKAGTQGSVMNPEDIQFGDVMGEYATALGENTGFYVDALNSIRHAFMNNKWGSKPDSEDEKYAKMFGGAMRDAVGTKPLQDDTVMKGARVVADPFVVGSRVKAGVDAVTDPKMWQAIIEDMSRGSRSQMFMPVVKWSGKGRDKGNDWLSGYTPQIQDAYKKFEQLSAQGVDPKEIFRQTRIFKNVDGIPYFETDDSMAKFGTQEFRDMVANGGNSMPLRQVMAHPELSPADYAYTTSKEVMVMPQKNYGAGWDRHSGVIYTYPDKRINFDGNVVDEFENNIVHEGNHMLASDANLQDSGSNMHLAHKKLNDYKTDLAYHGNVLAEETAKLQAKQNDIIAQRQKVIDQMDFRKRPIAMDEYAVLAKQKHELDKKLDALTKRERAMQRRADKEADFSAVGTYGLYLRNNGEALSRMAEARMPLDDIARRNTYPLDEKYFKDVTGYAPNDTWYNKYDPQMSQYENELVFPENIKAEILNYLKTGKKPFKPKVEK
jgi:hypothetical protein